MSKLDDIEEQTKSMTGVFVKETQAYISLVVGRTANEFEKGSLVYLNEPLVYVPPLERPLVADALGIMRGAGHVPGALIGNPLVMADFLKPHWDGMIDLEYNKVERDAGLVGFAYGCRVIETPDIPAGVVILVSELDAEVNYVRLNAVDLRY